MDNLGSALRKAITDDDLVLQLVDRFDAAIRAIHTAPSAESCLATVAEQARLLLSCQFAVVFRYEAGRGQGLLVAPEGEAGQGEEPRRFPLTAGIAGYAARDNVDYLTNSPGQDPYFRPEIDGYSGVTIRNVAASAMRVGERLKGVLEIQNLPGRDLDEADCIWLSKLADHGALALERLEAQESANRMALGLARLVGEVTEVYHGVMGHSSRVRLMALALARRLALGAQDRLDLELAVWLHQVGRLALLPESVKVARRERPEALLELEAQLTKSFLARLPKMGDQSRLSAIALNAHGWSAGGQAGSFVAATILQIADRYDRLVSGDGAPPLPAEQALAQLRQELGQGEGSPAQAVQAFIEGKCYEIEMRRHARFSCDAPLTFSLVDERTLEPRQPALQGKTLDLSETGLRFESAQEVGRAELLQVEVQLGGQLVRGMARVAHCQALKDRPAWVVGAYFLYSESP